MIDCQRAVLWIAGSPRHVEGYYVLERVVPTSQDGVE